MPPQHKPKSTNYGDTDRNPPPKKNHTTSQMDNPDVATNAQPPPNTENRRPKRPRAKSNQTEPLDQSETKKGNYRQTADRRGPPSLDTTPQNGSNNLTTPQNPGMSEPGPTRLPLPMHPLPGEITPSPPTSPSPAPAAWNRPPPPELTNYWTLTQSAPQT